MGILFDKALKVKHLALTAPFSTLRGRHTGSRLKGSQSILKYFPASSYAKSISKSASLSVLKKI